MRLTLLEQETIILFNEQETTASVDTCNKTLMRQLDDFTTKSTTVIVVSEDEHGKRYLIPKSWLKVQMPRQLSDEQRQKLREQAHKIFNKNNNNESGEMNYGN